MIKPATLWALCKTCPDSKWIGDVCRALGGQAVELDFGQQQVLATIRCDNGWMDERIEWQREANRKRVAKYREQLKAEKPTDAPGETAAIIEPCQPIPPPVRDPLIEQEAANAAAVTQTDPLDPVDLKTVVSTAISVMGVPEWYARWWHGEMKARGWEKTDGGRIDRRNWRSTLKAWYNREDQKHLDEIKTAFAEKVPQVIHVAPEDWTLCCERCANCAGTGCGVGVKIPPAVDPSHPRPPEECARFAPIAHIDPAGPRRTHEEPRRDARSRPDDKSHTRTAGTPHGAATGRCGAVPGVKTPPVTPKTPPDPSGTPPDRPETPGNGPLRRPQGSTPPDIPPAPGNAPTGQPGAEYPTP